jgi:nitrogenase molybdenum-iron protein beta chain
MYALTPGQTPCLVDEDFYLAIGWTFYGIIKVTYIKSSYDPDVVAVHTTCLSGTIGDDVNQIVKNAYKDGTIPEGKYVTRTATPSYVGSHVTGFSSMVKSIAVQKSAEGMAYDHLSIV